MVRILDNPTFLGGHRSYRLNKLAARLSRERERRLEPAQSFDDLVEDLRGQVSKEGSKDVVVIGELGKDRGVHQVVILARFCFGTKSRFSCLRPRPGSGKHSGYNPLLGCIYYLVSCSRNLREKADSFCPKSFVRNEDVDRASPPENIY